MSVWHPNRRLVQRKRVVMLHCTYVRTYFRIIDFFQTTNNNNELQQAGEEKAKT